MGGNLLAGSYHHDKRASESEPGKPSVLANTDSLRVTVKAKKVYSLQKYQRWEGNMGGVTMENIRR